MHRTRLRRWVIAAVAASGLSCGSPEAVSAQGAPVPAPVTTPTAGSDAYTLLFQQMLARPADLDVSFRFAAMAAQMGDYEAAIGALERMIFYNPNLPRVRLELGVLYFKIGSYEMARSYFDSALASGDVPADVRTKVQTFLAEIDKRMNPTQWAFFGQMGLRYQTNATAGPSSPFVRAAGLDAVLDRQFVRQSDWNAFALGTLRHSYDLGTQRGDTWETTVSAYRSVQFKFSRLDLALVEGQTGPRFALFQDWVGSSIRPYVVGTAVSLSDEPYLGSKGAGVSLGLPVPGLGLVEPFVELRSRHFGNIRTEYPTAAEQTGKLWSAGIVAQGDIAGPWLRWQMRAAYMRNDTRREYNSYDQAAFDLALPLEFDGPWGNRRWAVVPNVGFAHYVYDGPNAIVDPLVRRIENEFRAGAVIDVPVKDWLGFATQFQYAAVGSTLPNYRTSNFSVLFGPTVRY